MAFNNNKTYPKSRKPALETFTVAALMLPGLLQSGAYAAVEDDEVDFQYSHYQEGKRDIYAEDINISGHSSFNKIPSVLLFNPIEADSLRGSSRLAITDRIKFAFNYTQDTWAGATPIGTAPAVAGAMKAVNKIGGNYNTPIVGASPYAKELGGANFFMDKQGNTYALDAKNDPVAGYYTYFPGQKNNQLTHVLVSASPETRKQGDFNLGYDWDEAAVTVGGGLSLENDYESRFGNLGGRWDFNQKQTSVNAGLSYTNSDTMATVDPAVATFVDLSRYMQHWAKVHDASDGVTYQGHDPVTGGTLTKTTDHLNNNVYTLSGNRQDWGSQLGLTQVVSKNALVSLGMGYTRSTGFLTNPYKAVWAFTAHPYPDQDTNKPLLYQFENPGRLEARPTERNQLNWTAGYNQFIEPMAAALHVNYSFAHDDWGINAHTLAADWVQPVGEGWTLTPHVRYYSQSSADFYAPFFTQVQAVENLGPNAVGNLVDSPLNRALPKYYSSDQRLSGFGALSGGLTVSKLFAKGVSVETGFEYYSHQGGLKLGGGGEQDFADYGFFSANAALKLNLGAISTQHGGDGTASHPHYHANAPAGILFDHVLKQSGDLMVGYRYMRNEQAGSMLHGSHPVGQNELLLNGCVDTKCMSVPNSMTMNMHMLDLMVAPTDWLTLMLMPQWQDMQMDMSMLVDTTSTTGHSHHGDMVHNHQTGGLGDTGLYALFKLFEQSGHQLNLSLGGTAPTGDVALMIRKTHPEIPNTPIHYGMQLGSGTWDFRPSLTYTGEQDFFTWGAQATGTKRLESQNKFNYALGDIFQSSAWGGYQWTHWLTTTVRGVYTWQGSIQGQYSDRDLEGTPLPYPYSPRNVGTFDKPGNYGGRFVDLGLGVNVTIPGGAFAGNTLKFEWLQPIHTDYNGYQLDRDGALSASWSMGF